MVVRWVGGFCVLKNFHADEKWVARKESERCGSVVLYCTVPVRGSWGPRAVLNLHLCVRRSGVLGVEMKTLPVNGVYTGSVRTNLPSWTATSTGTARRALKHGRVLTHKCKCARPDMDTWNVLKACLLGRAD